MVNSGASVVCSTTIPRPLVRKYAWTAETRGGQIKETHWRLIENNKELPFFKDLLVYYETWLDVSRPSSLRPCCVVSCSSRSDTQFCICKFSNTSLKVLFIDVFVLYIVI